VSDTSRLGTVDVLRGFALLGILMMNIPFFGMEAHFAEAFQANPRTADFWILHVVSVVFEGKMRALFGMVFGAGVFLFCESKERPASLFYRRMGWLVIFGLLQAHLLLWMGDILYLYGLCGMLVFLLRRVSPRLLLWAVPLVAVVNNVAWGFEHYGMHKKRLAYVAAIAQPSPNEAERRAIDEWRQLERVMIPGREEAKEQTRLMRGSYAEVASLVREQAFYWETKGLPMELPDSIALMLLGLALLRLGFLGGQWSSRAYWRTLIIGYGVGLPLVTASEVYYTLAVPNLEAGLARLETTPVEWVGFLYPFQRILLVLAHASALILIVRSGRMLAGLARVGQMAFTNYIGQSILCTLFFFGYGLGMYGRLAYHQAAYVVLLIWALQIAASRLWLARFRFGPLEWLWRSLTYWHLQPMRRR
jgi:uncharacterized protein